MAIECGGDVSGKSCFGDFEFGHRPTRLRPLGPRGRPKTVTGRGGTYVPIMSECQNPSFSILRPCRSFTVVFALFFVALADLPTEILQQRVNMSGTVKVHPAVVRLSPVCQYVGSDA